MPGSLFRSEHMRWYPAICAGYELTITPSQFQALD
jgi:hypothetical protein